MNQTERRMRSIIFKDYKITSPFGYRDHLISGKRLFHTGIDTVKEHQSPIRAFTEGTVLYTGFGHTETGLGGYGNVVLIKDKNNCGQLYAHLDSVSVKAEQSIEKGDVIGLQGSTGMSTGTHLHYEVRKKAETEVPYGWTADRENNCFDPTHYLTQYNSW